MGTLKDQYAEAQESSKRADNDRQTAKTQDAQARVKAGKDGILGSLFGGDGSGSAWGGTDTLRERYAKDCANAADGQAQATGRRTALTDPDQSALAAGKLKKGGKVRLKHQSQSQSQQRRGG